MEDCTAVAYTVCNVDVKPIINGIITEKKSSGKLFIIAYTLEYSPLNNVGRVSYEFNVACLCRKTLCY